MSEAQLNCDLECQKSRRKAKADGMRQAADMILAEATKDSDGTVTTGMWAFDELRAAADKIEQGIFPTLKEWQDHNISCPRCVGNESKRENCQVCEGDGLVTQPEYNAWLVEHGEISADADIELPEGFLQAWRNSRIVKED